MSPFLLLIFIVPGAIIFFLGKYIGKTGYIEILKSYNDKATYNKDGLANYVKRLMMITGVLTILLSIIGFVIAMLTDNELIIGVVLLIYSVVTINYMIRLRTSCKKFEVK